MQPRFDKNLKVLVQEDMTVEEVENMVRTSKYNGFPIITDSVSKKLIGYVYRRDLIVALGKCNYSNVLMPKNLASNTKCTEQLVRNGLKNQEQSS